MKPLKKGKLNYTIKYDESALKLIADMQKKIDEYERALDNILLCLIDYDAVTIKSTDHRAVGVIHDKILQYKKELMKTEAGREFLSRHNIDIISTLK